MNDLNDVVDAIILNDDIIELDTVVYPEQQFLDVDSLVRMIAKMDTWIVANLMNGLMSLDGDMNVTDSEARMAEMILRKLCAAHPPARRFAATM